jgi:predicted ATPase
MFRRIEAYHYRSLKSVDQTLGPFEILVGPNGSGKSSFLDVIAFLSTLAAEGLDAAVEERTANFHDLVWGREGDCFKLGVEAVIPEERRAKHPDTGAVLDVIHYETSVLIDVQTGKHHIGEESATMLASAPVPDSGIEVLKRNDSVCWFRSLPGEHRFERSNQHRNYYALQYTPFESALGWLHQTLREGIKFVALNVENLRNPAPPATSDKKEMRGAYFARSVAQLAGSDRFQDWLAHVRTALPEIANIRAVRRDEDKHRYVMVRYKNDVEVPSWMVSDGTLRLLALTLLAYLPEFAGTYLIEEPENGVHPAALETIYQSLSSLYDAQVLIASQSPLLLGMAEPEQLLCFMQERDGTRIIRGSEHPALRDWRREVSLGTLMASGILG